MILDKNCPLCNGRGYVKYRSFFGEVDYKVCGRCDMVESEEAKREREIENDRIHLAEWATDQAWEKNSGT